MRHLFFAELVAQQPHGTGKSTLINRIPLMCTLEVTRVEFLFCINFAERKFDPKRFTSKQIALGMR